MDHLQHGHYRVGHRVHLKNLHQDQVITVNQAISEIEAQ